MNGKAFAIKNIIINNRGKGHISIRKICEQINDKEPNNQKIKLSKSHRIIRNIL